MKLRVFTVLMFIATVFIPIVVFNIVSIVSVNSANTTIKNEIRTSSANEILSATNRELSFVADLAVPLAAELNEEIEYLNSIGYEERKPEDGFDPVLGACGNIIDRRLAFSERISESIIFDKDTGRILFRGANNTTSIFNPDVHTIQEGFAIQIRGGGVEIYYASMISDSLISLTSVYTPDLKSVVKNTYNTTPYLIDASGNIFDGDKIVGNINLDENTFSDIRSAYHKGSGSQDEIFFSDFKYIHKDTEYSHSGFSVAITHTGVDFAEKSVNVIANIILISVIFSIIAIVFTIWFFKPVKMIYDTLVDVSRSKFDKRVVFDKLPLGQVFKFLDYGEIANQFNDFADKTIVNRERVFTILETTENIVFEWDYKTGHITFSNNYMKKFAYRSSDDTYSKSLLRNLEIFEEDAEKYKDDLTALENRNAVHYAEYRIKNIFGDFVWFSLITGVIPDSSGKIVKTVGILTDINRRKLNMEATKSEATFDALTQCYNRKSIESAINDEIAAIRIRKSPFAILFIDVDNFKFYNDNYSHATGDSVLRFVSATISRIISNFGLLGRYGGDEFIACARHTNVNNPSVVAQQILADLAEGFICEEGDRLTVSVSIGIAEVKDSKLSLEEIVALSDEAMYRVKKNGKGNYGFIFN